MKTKAIITISSLLALAGGAILTASAASEAPVPSKPPFPAPVSTPADEAIHAREVSATPPEAPGNGAAFQAFARWRNDLSSASPIWSPQWRAWLANGVRLAGERRAALLKWMREQPQRALEHSLPWHDWAALPAPVQALVEEPFSVTADFVVTTVCNPTGKEPEQEPTYRIMLRDQLLAASVYGRRCGLKSKCGLPLQGIRLGDHVALWESAVQPLTSEELGVVRGLFPEGNRPTHSWWSGQPLGAQSCAALIGGKIYYFGSEEETQALETKIAEAENGIGPYTVERALTAASGGEVFAADLFEAAAKTASAEWTESPKRVLCLRLDFTPSEGTPYTQADLQTTMQTCSDLIQEMSYGKTWLVPTVTTQVFCLSGPASDYASRGTIYSEAAALATARGYRLSDYDFLVFTYQNAPHGAGQTSGGNVYLNGRQPDSVLVHELGHVYTLGHAGAWTPAGSGFLGHRGLNERADFAESSVYGDVFDLMGYDRYPDVFPKGHYSMHAKACLNWIEADKVATATTTGRYRVYRFDHRNARSAPGALALKILNRDGEELWVGYRRNFTSNPSLSTGAYIIWAAPWGGRDWHYLLDATPLSKLNQAIGKNREDAALPLNHTFTDPSGSVRIKNAGSGGVSPYEYLELDVAFVTNQPPCELFTDTSRTTPGLRGSYVNRSLRTRLAKDDWRAAADVAIAGTRVDNSLRFLGNGWGARATVGLTHGSDANWEDFSVQWDGVLVVHRPIRLATKSDDSSRMWVDLNGDGVFAATGPEFLDNQWGKETDRTLGTISQTIGRGRYLVRIQYETAKGDNNFSLLTSEVQFDVFVNSSLTTPGLSGSYVNQALRNYAPQDDWRSSQTIAGTRTDAYPGYWVYAWGDLAALGITGATGDAENPFNQFSVQWDGWLRVHQPLQLAAFSDDASRMWIDLNHDGQFDTNGVEFINNNWGSTQGTTLGNLSATIVPGTYPLRIQYYDNTGSDYFLLCGEPAMNINFWIGGASGYWATGANWSRGTAPLDGDDLVFPPGALRIVTTNNTSSAHRFRSVFITSEDYVLRGNGLSLANGLFATYDTGGSTVELDITLRDSQTFTCLNSGLRLDVTGAVDLGGYTLSVDGIGNVHLGGVLSGTGGLTKNGTGALYLEGPAPNTYNGVTRVNAGRIVLNKNVYPAIPHGELIIGDGIGGPDADMVLANRNYQIGPIPVTINSSGILDLEGYDDAVGAITINGGHIATGGELAIGTLILSDNVTVTAGGRALIEGKVELRTARAFDVANSPASPDLELRAVVIGAGGLIKNGSGALGLYAANTFHGTVTINSGLVYAYSPLALGTNTAGTTVSSGGVLVIANNTHLADEPLTLNGAGDGISGALTSTGGSNSCAGTVMLASDAVITVRTNCHLNLTGVITGPGHLIKRQPGTLILSGMSANAFTGEAQVEEGALEMDKSVANGAVPGTLRVGTDSGPSQSVVARNRRSSQCNSVVVNASGLYDLNGFNETVTELTLNLGGDVRTGTGTLTLGTGCNVSVYHNPLVLAGTVATISGKLNVGSGSHRLNVLHGMPPLWNPVDFEVEATVSGSATLIKEGNGVMALTASNSFTGDLDISNGAVRITNPAALGATVGGTAVHPGAQLALVGGLTVAGETLNFAGGGSGTLLASNGSNAWTGNVTLQGDATIHIPGATDALNLNGIMTGTGGVLKTGTGTLTFSGAGANSYSGQTMISAGVLELKKTANNGAIQGSLVVGDGSGGTDADVVRIGIGAVEQIGDTAPVAVASSGLLDLRSGGERVGALSGSGHVHTEGAIFEVNYDNRSSVFSGTITGSGSPRKTGTGTLVLSGTNKHTGTTVVSNGRLQVDGHQPDSPVHVTANGTLSGTGLVGRLTAPGGRVAPGASPGILTCSNVTFAPATTFEVELNGTKAGSGCDQLNVHGTVNAGDAALRVLLGFTPAEGDQFIILANDGSEAVTGTFAGLTNGAVFAVGAAEFRIRYDAGTGNDVGLTVTRIISPLRITTVVPVDTNLALSWVGGAPLYVVEKTSELNSNTAWQVITAPLNTTNTSVPRNTPDGFFRIRGGQ